MAVIQPPGGVRTGFAPIGIASPGQTARTCERRATPRRRRSAARRVSRACHARVQPPHPSKSHERRAGGFAARANRPQNHRQNAKPVAISKSAAAVMSCLRRRLLAPLYMASMRWVTRKPPKMLTEASDQRDEAEGCAHHGPPASPAADADGEQRADDDDAGDGVGHRHQRRVQRRRHRPDDVVADEDREHEDRRGGRRTDRWRRRWRHGRRRRSPRRPGRRRSAPR